MNLKEGDITLLELRKSVSNLSAISLTFLLACILMMLLAGSVAQSVFMNLYIN